MAVLGMAGTVLLTLLKVVLIVLCLVLAIVLIVLFVPVRYGVWLEKEEAFSARVRVSWLCHLVCFRVLYEQGEPKITLRVFGFNLYSWLQGRKKRADSGAEVQEDFPEKASEEIHDTDRDMEETDVSMAEVRLPEYEEREKERAIERDVDINADTERDKDREAYIEEDLAGKSIIERLRRFWRELLNRFREIVYFFKKLRKIAQKLCRRAEWLGEVKAFWGSENTKQMVCIFRDNVLHLWRKLKPGTVKGQVWFGTGDPCSTGQILGACAILFACYGNGIAVTPDFERQILKGKLMLKGHLSVITAVVILVKVLFSRQWKIFRREWNMIGGSLNE